MTFKEITVKIKSEDKSYKKKFSCYEQDICISEHDPKLNKMVQETLGELKEPLERAEIAISILIPWS